MYTIGHLDSFTGAGDNLVLAGPEAACVTTVDAAFLNFLNRLEHDSAVNPQAREFSRSAHDFFGITPLNLEDANQMKGRVGREYTATALEALDVAEVCLSDAEYLAEATGLIAVKFAQRTGRYRKLLEFSGENTEVLTQLAANTYHDGQTVQQSIESGVDKYPDSTPPKVAIRAVSGSVIRFQLVDEELELTRALRPSPERDNLTARFRRRGFLPWLLR